MYYYNDNNNFTARKNPLLDNIKKLNREYDTSNDSLISDVIKRDGNDFSFDDVFGSKEIDEQTNPMYERKKKDYIDFPLTKSSVANFSYIPTSEEDKINDMMEDFRMSDQNDTMSNSEINVIRKKLIDLDLPIMANNIKYKHAGLKHLEAIKSKMEQGKNEEEKEEGKKIVIKHETVGTNVFV